MFLNNEEWITIEAEKTFEVPAKNYWLLAVPIDCRDVREPLLRCKDSLLLSCIDYTAEKER